MPSIRVRALPQKPDVDLPATMAEMRDLVAEKIVAPADGIRVLWQQLDPGMYLEKGELPAAQPRATHPPTVELVAFEGRTPEQIQAALEGLAEIVARRLGLEPGNAWVNYVEAADGHLYVGGGMKRHPAPSTG